MRIADVDRDDRQPLSGDVDLLVGRDDGLAQLLPDNPVRSGRRRADDAASRVDLDVGRAGFPQEPGGGDPRSVARQLRRRPVRIPDPNGRPGVVAAGDLQHAVGADPEADVAEAPHAIRDEVATVGPLDEEVRVAERVPLLEAHRLRLPAYVREDVRGDGRRVAGGFHENDAGNSPHPLALVRGVPPRADDDPLERVAPARALRSRAVRASSPPCATRAARALLGPPRRPRARTSPPPGHGCVVPARRSRPRARRSVSGVGSSCPRAGPRAASASLRLPRARERARDAVGRSGGRSRRWWDRVRRGARVRRHGRGRPPPRCGP